MNYEQKIKEYLNLAKYFLVNIGSIEDCIGEAQKTALYISELLELKFDLEKIYNELNLQLDIFISKKKDSIRDSLKNSGVSYTEKMIEERMIRLYVDEYMKLRSETNQARSNFELVNSLFMVMMQRKDLIKETIDCLKCSKDKEGCIMNNRQFIKKLERLFGD